MSLLTRVRTAIPPSPLRGYGVAGLSLLFIAIVAVTVIWLSGARNPYTPAGYVGYTAAPARVKENAQKIAEETRR